MCFDYLWRSHRSPAAAQLDVRLPEALTRIICSEIGFEMRSMIEDVQILKMNNGESKIP